MNELIKKVISIEEEAQHIIDAAKHEEGNIRRALDDDVKKLEEQILIKQKEKLRQLKNLELSEAKEIVQNTEKETQEKIDKMNEYANANIEKWADELIHSVLER